MDRFELIVLVVFAGVSFWILALDVWQVAFRGRSWTGGDGMFVADQLQYMAWVRDASHSVLVSNLFVLTRTPADFFSPLVAISGGITALGVAPSLALLLWQPVAVGGAFFATRAYVHRTISDSTARHVALVLGLFFGCVAIFPDLWLPFWSWGYPFALIALAAMLTALLVYERDRGKARASRAAPLLAALVSWLHPWQGENLILVLIGAEALMRERWSARRLAYLLGTVAAAAVPLGYYAILSHVDLSWRLGQDAGRGPFPLSKLAVTFAPLAIPALLAYRATPRSFSSAATRVWPIAALCAFLFSEHFASGALHAFLGITIPLAILAVKGARTLPTPVSLPRGAWGALIVLAVAAVTVPATVYELNDGRELAAPTSGNDNFIKQGEQRALNYLARDPQPGGVLSEIYLGTLVPAETGRRTYAGDYFWSQPDYFQRAKLAADLFSGRMRSAAARTFVRGTGARFLLADCRSAAGLRPLLGTLTRAPHQFGCASVYTVAEAPRDSRGRHSGRPRGPTR